MRKYAGYILAVLMVTVAGVVILVGFINNKTVLIKEYAQAERAARIKPDYSDIVVPFNISAMNFVIKEAGESFFVKIYSEKGTAIEIFSKKPKIKIPQKAWRNLLENNRGNKLCFDIFIKTKDEGWKKFLTINNKISNEPIDGFIIYRKIHPVHGLAGPMSIEERNLHNFNTKEILNSNFVRNACINCHCFNNNKPDKMLLGVRSKAYGIQTIVVEGDESFKLNTKFSYASWHPSGKLVVSSLSDVRQFFHSANNEARDVIELDALLFYYLVDSKTIKTNPIFSQREWLETYPAWSADGRYLYFCRAPKLWENTEGIPYEKFEKTKYDLVRISYDVTNDKWGELETVLSAKDTGLSILEPRISPDGRWLVAIMCDYGFFPLYKHKKSGDIYLINLQDAQKNGQYEYKQLEINSEQGESWPGWSSNGRWIVFSTKRDVQPFTRIYFSYFDETGKAYKPFIMPQEDPEFYDSCLFTFSVPEFITEPVKVSTGSLADVIRGKGEIHLEMPMTMATPKATGLPKSQDAWQQRE